MQSLTRMHDRPESVSRIAATGAVSPPVRRPMLLELESIRGLAALLVVVHHLPAWNLSLWDSPIVRNSYLMVDVFFVLSGFVMYKAYGGTITTSSGLMRFQLLRLGRLYPVHAAFLVVWACVELAKQAAAARLGLVGASAGGGHANTWAALLEHVLLLQAIGPTGHALTFNAAAWSISTEFYTYLVFGGVALLARRAAPLIHLAICGGSLALIVTGAGADHVLLLRCLAGFFLGCCVATLMHRFAFSTPRWSLPAAFAALLVFLHLKSGSAYDSLMLPLSAALIVCALTSEPGPVRRALNARPLAWLGSISYSLYMSHTLVIWGTTQAIRIGLKRPESLIEGAGAPQLSLAEAAFTNLFILVAAMAFAALVYRFLEKPSRDISRALLLRQPT